MDFGLSDEQRQLADTLDRYLTDKCPTTRVRAVMESESGHDPALWGELMDLGLGMILVPEEHGGLSGDLLDLAVAAEQLGRHATPSPLLGHAMATVALAGSEDRALAAQWLPLLASGEAVGAAALGEVGGRWEPCEMEALVTGGSLSGEKPLVAGAAADFFVVAAKDENGPGLWFVEAGAAGVEISTLEVNDLTRPVSAIEFKDVAAHRVGGAELHGRVLDAGLVLLAADAHGGADRCLFMARDYALEREQFGQLIGAFQAVKHKLADMAADLAPTKALYWYAAHAFDSVPEQTSKHAAVAKAHLTDVFDRIARESIELHGGIGFTWEFDLHLWFRRSIFDRSYLGDARYHRARAAALSGW